jgi:hypothetical protein
MVCFQTKNPNSGKFWRVLQWKMLVYFMSIWSILRPLEIFYGPLVYFVVIWYIFPPFYVVPRKIWQPWSAQWQHNIFFIFTHFSDQWQDKNFLIFCLSDAGLPKNGGKMPSDHKIYRMATKYAEWL